MRLRPRKFRDEYLPAKVGSWVENIRFESELEVGAALDVGAPGASGTLWPEVSGRSLLAYIYLHLPTLCIYRLDEILW